MSPQTKMGRFRSLVFVLTLPPMAFAFHCKKRDHFREIVTTEARIILAADGRSAAGYMTMENFTTGPDFLIGVECDFAKKIEFRETYVVDYEFKTRPLRRIVVPAGGRAKLEPEGLHLSLRELIRRPRAGESVKLVLNFQHCGKKKVAARVGTDLSVIYDNP